MRVRNLRLERGWSQEQLAEKSGLSVRTVQRIDRGGHAGLASLQSLAAALEVNVAVLGPESIHSSGDMQPAEAVVHALRHYADFSGQASRAEFWWFTLALTVALAALSQAATWPAATLLTVALVPWLAAGARRLRDAGQSPWWLAILLAPVGGLVIVGFLCAMPSQEGSVVPNNATG